MKKNITFILTLLFFLAANAQSNNTPNVLFIVVDDLGWSDVNFTQPHHAYQTPNLQALAENGLVYTNAYGAASNCAPSRATLMSGMYTPRHRVFTVGRPGRGDARTRRLIPTRNARTINDGIFTLAEMFKEKGYTTGNFGKWHISANPLSQGFDVNVGGNGRGAPVTYFSPYQMPGINDGPDDEYLTERLTNDAANWITENKDQPFFAYVPFYTVHTPLEPLENILEKYTNNLRILSDQQANYAAMIETMDTNIGKLITTLRDNNLLDNTLIVFTSDHGGVNTISSQIPLRSGKGSYYEGGIRTPLLVYWQDKIHKSVNDTPVINADFFPTFAQMLNFDTQDLTLDGLSLYHQWLHQNPLEERALFWHFPFYLQADNPLVDQSRDPLFRTRPGRAIRRGDWKLIHYFEDDHYELYNLSEDISEINNVAQTQTDIRDALLRELDQFQQETNAPIPRIPNNRFNEILETDSIQSIRNDPNFGGGYPLPHDLPKRIQAEHYIRTTGETTIGNTNTDPITQCVYYGLSVDIENASEGTCNVTATQTNETLIYQLANAGNTYDITLRTASLVSNKKVSIFINNSFAGTIETQGLGAQSWTSHIIENIEIPDFAQIEVVFDDPEVKLDYIDIQLTDDSSLITSKDSMIISLDSIEATLDRRYFANVSENITITNTTNTRQHIDIILKPNSIAQAIELRYPRRLHIPAYTQRNFNFRAISRLLTQDKAHQTSTGNIIIEHGNNRHEIPYKVSFSP